MANYELQPIPLHHETRIAVTTAEAAFHLGRCPQTLRVWAIRGGPINPRRVHGRLMWLVADIRKVLGVDND